MNNFVPIEVTQQIKQRNENKTGQEKTGGYFNGGKIKRMSAKSTHRTPERDSQSIQKLISTNYIAYCAGHHKRSEHSQERGKNILELLFGSPYVDKYN